MEKKIRLGIVGTGRIVARVMADMHNTTEIEVAAIAARTQEKADAAARQFGIPLAFPTFQAMAESDAIDLAYIALPHPFHAEYACMMMNHGKHVLCEKPMAVHDADTRRMIECARQNGVFLMEAMWTRFMPCVRKMMELIGEGVLGEIHHVFGTFSYALSGYDPEDRLFNPALAGGALLDVGVYPLMACTLLLGWQPEKVQGLCVKAPEGVDVRTSVQMQYASGATAQFFCGMDARSNDVLQVFGTKAYLTMPGLWHPTSFTLCEKNRPEQQFSFPPENEGHHYEFDHAARCIREGRLESPLVTWEESLAVAEICTRIRHEKV